MDKKTTAVLAGGILVTLLLLVVSIYAAGIAFILLIVLVMSLLIMQDTTFMPLVEARLREDAKAMIVSNTGNSPALKIHVTLVPLNIEFRVPSLAADASYEYAFASMIEEVKVVISYENEKGQAFSHARKLSATGDQFEPLKPVIPLFGWK